MWPGFSDFYVSVIILLLLSRVREAVMICCVPRVAPLIHPKFTGRDRQERTRKTAKYVFKMGYYAIELLAGYWALGDQDFLPPSLLGGGDPTVCYRDYPLTEVAPKIKAYYLFTFAYHLDSFLVLLLEGPRKDFGELFLHHFTTLVLISFSYLSNFARCGSMVLFVHDFSELPIAVCRIFVDMKGKKWIVVGSFAALVLSWVYSRIVVFPKDVIMGITRSGWRYEVHYNNTFLLGLLWVLLVLHVNWLYLFLKIGLHLLKSNQAEDLVSKDAFQEQTQKNKNSD